MLMTPVSAIDQTAICKPTGRTKAVKDESDDAITRPSVVNPGMIMLKLLAGLQEDAVRTYGPIALIPGLWMFLPAPPYRR